MQARKNTLRFVVSIAKNKPAWREWNEEDQNAKDGWYSRDQVSTSIHDPEGTLIGTPQTGIGLAVPYGLYANNVEQRNTATDALDKLARTARFHVSTGFAGTPIMLHALTKIGKTQLAYRMLLEQTCPSWHYALSMGATTISMLPNGYINPGQLTSFNQYAYGSVADWLHTTVGGSSPHEPGWRVVRVRPVSGGNLTRAHVSFDGPYD